MWLCFSFNKLNEPNVQKFNMKIYQDGMKIWAHLDITVVKLTPENLISFMIKKDLKTLFFQRFAESFQLEFLFRVYLSTEYVFTFSLTFSWLSSLAEKIQLR